MAGCMSRSWRGCFVAALLFLGAVAAPAQEAHAPRLSAPLGTLVPGPALNGSPVVLQATVVVPADAPSDLGIGAYVTDVHGTWFQTLSTEAMTPGEHHLRFDLGPGAALSSPAGFQWSAAFSSLARRSGLFFWSASLASAHVRVVRLVAVAEPVAPAGTVRLLEDLHLDGISADGAAHVRAGDRWTMTAVPRPLPANPDDPRQFALDAVFTDSDGKAVTIPAFSWQPMTLVDRGDREDAVPAGAWRMCLRWRPSQPGRYHLDLRASWAGADPLRITLPDVVVDGPAVDQIAHVDAKDPRFFEVDGRFWWPLGLNLHGVYDLRSEQSLGTRLTVDRRAAATIAQLKRLGAAGGNAAEIWMSSWNLGLEWRADWPGFDGMGRFSQENAARLDAVLDAAWAAGVRINLVINNHGQVADRMDSEWEDNPWNAELGGPIAEPLGMFTDPAALAGQERLRRYLVARYADHPAILGWKLWSEINLTAGDGSDAAHAQLKKWHADAAARWHALDTYGHPVSTHWSGDYRSSSWDIAGLPGLDYLCIDAYHNNRNGDSLLAQLLSDSVLDSAEGLGRFHKPILVTEYGGSAMGADEAVLEAEHASGAWSALVSGHGGAPMLWWFEWVDQGDRYQPYRALSRFIAGEDLRGSSAHAVDLNPQPGSAGLWGQAWSRPGRMLGYLVDRAWQEGWGAVVHAPDSVTVTIGNAVAPGHLTVEWWDADTGVRLVKQTINHPGGALRLQTPGFQRHLAFKLWREN